MAVVAIASAKGGVGKSTLAILLGAEFALDGYTVAIIDSDLNQHTAAFGLKCTLPGLRVIPDVGEAGILKALREAEAKSDIVLIDLPGGSSTLALKAMQRSHFVLVPMRPSLPDAPKTPRKRTSRRACAASCGWRSPTSSAACS